MCGLKEPCVPLAIAKPALIWLRSWRMASPRARLRQASPAPAQGPSPVIWVQNSRRRSTRASGALPAMMAVLMAPTDPPAIQFG